MRFRNFMKGRWFLFVSILLSITAIFQVFLIFGNPFDFGDSEIQTQEKEQGEADLLQPVALYVTLGGEENGSYVRVAINDPDYSETKRDMCRLMARCFQNMILCESSEDELPEGALLCYMKMGMIMDETLLAAQVDMAPEDLPAVRFDLILVAPSAAQGQEVLIFFVSSSEHTVWKMLAGEREWEENLAVYRDLLSLGSRALSGGERWTDAGKAYGDRFSLGSFVNDHEVDASRERSSLSVAFSDEGSVKRYAYTFFEYKDSVSLEGNLGTGMVFTNEKISLKYLSSGVMHYIETATDSEKVSSTLMEAYRIAAEYLEADMTAAGEMNLVPVLADYRIEDGEYVFCFDYMYGGEYLALQHLPDDMEGEKHPVYIRVRGSIVHECRRWVIHIRETETRILNFNWLSAADQVSRKLREEAAENKIVSVPEIGYCYNGSILQIVWRIQLKDGSVVYLAD